MADNKQPAGPINMHKRLAAGEPVDGTTTKSQGTSGASKPAAKSKK